MNSASLRRTVFAHVECSSLAAELLPLLVQHFQIVTDLEKAEAVDLIVTDRSSSAEALRAFPATSAASFLLLTDDLQQLETGSGASDVFLLPFHPAALLRRLRLLADLAFHARENDRHTLLIDSARLATWEWHIATNRLTWNNECKRLFGLAPEDEVDADWYFAHQHPEDAPIARAAVQRALEERTSYQLELRILTVDGTIRWQAASGSGFYDAENRPLGLRGVARDITDRKESELRLQDALRHARQTQAELETASAAKDQFLAILSHELRTPLMPVLMNLDLWSTDERLPEDIRSSFELMRRNIELEARLIDDLLDLTAISRGKMRMRAQTVDLHELVSHAVETGCTSDANLKRINIEMRLDARATNVHADAARIAQVLLNLGRNAVKFTPPNGRILIHTFNPAPRRIAVEVSDSGIGITPETLPRLFNPFEQGDPAITRRYGGLGLGLAISKAIVELHQGHLSVRSDGEGRGATFRLELATTAAQITTRGNRPSVPDSNSQPQLRILLVEDHIHTAQILSRLLARRHLVTVTHTVQAALEAAADAEFDLLISDMGLPDGTGLELMRTLRDRPGLRAIALSGFGMEKDLQASMEAGFADHIVKPVDWKQLEAVIARVMAAPARGAVNDPAG